MPIIQISLRLALLCLILLIIYPYIYSRSETRTEAVVRTARWVFIVGVSGNWVSMQAETYGGWYDLLMVAWAGWVIGFFIKAVFRYYTAGVQIRRTIGPRKSPINFNLASIGLFASLSLCIITLCVIMPSYSWINLFRLIWFVPILIYFINFGRRFSYQYLHIAKDTSSLPKGGVLFIREFRTEKEPFWTGIWSSLTFEEFFSQSFVEGIGPLMGLANPLDTAPTGNPEMVYGPDDVWQQNLLHLLRYSKAIVLKAGASGNVDWELEQIHKQSAIDRFFIFTPPTQPDTRWSIWFRRWLYGAHPLIWHEFVLRMRQLGFTLPMHSPGPGSVIGFYENAQGVVLLAGAKSAKHYTEVMVEWLNKGSN